MIDTPVEVRNRMTCRSSDWKVSNEGLDTSVCIQAPHVGFECEDIDDLRNLHAAITKFIELAEAEGVES